MLCAAHVALTPTALSDAIFRKDHRHCEVLDAAEVLVEIGEDAEFRSVLVKMLST